MKPRVYIETTIPSFYYEIRTEPEMVSRRHWTRDWWDNHRARYFPVTSIPVVDELQNGEHPKRKKCLTMMDDLPFLPISDSIVEIVDAYMEHHVMPRDPKGDALHLALASYHRCQFLLTWNCAHLANANKTEHIRHVNTLLGLHVPTLTTPLELLNGLEDGT